MASKVLLAAVVGLVASATDGVAPLSMTVRPSVAFAPANVVVQTRVESSSANRALQIIAESSEFYRSSEIGIDGESAPRTAMFQLQGLPAGRYSVRAILKGQAGGEIATVATLVTLIEGIPRGGKRP